MSAQRWPVRPTMVAAAALVASGCNGSSWTPFIASVDPSPIVTGTTKFDVFGGRFSPGATVQWNGRAVPTTFRSETFVQVTLAAADTADPAEVAISVSNPGGYPSREYPVFVVDPTLRLDSISPVSASAGAPDFTLTALGAGFLPTSRIRWNGVDLPTRFVSKTQLTATITSAISELGSAVVTVATFPCSVTVCLPLVSNALSCSIGLGAAVTVLPEAGVEIAADPVRERLYVSMPANAPDYPNSLLAIDPRSGQIFSSAAAPRPSLLAPAGDGQLLYAVTSELSLTRYELPDLTRSTTWNLGDYVESLQVAPGAPGTTAVAMSSGRVRILDDGVPRTNTTIVYHASLQWGVDATQLFAAQASDPTLHRLAVDATGIGAHTAVYVGVGDRPRIHYEAVTRRLYTDSGVSVDEQLSNTTRFALAERSSCVMTPDGGTGKAFYACLESMDATTLRLVIRAFDLSTRELLGMLMLDSWPAGSTTVKNPARIVRWGTSGVAVAATAYGGGTVSGTIYSYGGPFIQ